MTGMHHSWLRIAHRGASGTTPEHTRPAFERALSFGVQMIELDVQFSRDLELVVIHDHELQRTTSGAGLVRSHDFAELKSLDAGGWFGAEFVGERSLSLDEVIHIVRGRARLNVEVKAPAADWPELAVRLVRLLRRHSILETTVLSCFAPGALMALRDEAADACLGLLWQHPDFSQAWDAATTLRAASIHPYWMLASAELVNDAHTRGLQVLVWTVNVVEVMRGLVQHGVDGIISDFPERFGDVVP